MHDKCSRINYIGILFKLGNFLYVTILPTQVPRSRNFYVHDKSSNSVHERFNLTKTGSKRIHLRYSLRILVIAFIIFNIHVLKVSCMHDNLLKTNLIICITCLNVITACLALRWFLIANNAKNSDVHHLNVSKLTFFARTILKLPYF